MTTLPFPAWIDDYQLWIASHWLQIGDKHAPRRLSPNRGGRMKPEIVVLHETAGRLDADSASNWLCDPKAKASAHLVVDRDGGVKQLVPFDTVAWHAGRSSYKGRPDVNEFSIGIEMVGPGRMEPSREGYVQAWFGEDYSIAEHDIALVGTQDHGSGWWMPFTDKQIRMTIALCRLLVETYDLTDVTGHYAVSPGRKVDPNPLFPIYWARKLALGEEASRAQPMGSA